MNHKTQAGNFIRSLFDGWTSSQVELLTLLVFAFLLRIGVIFAFPSLYHPDENFQFFEQAHRIAFGYGIRPWEFTDGIRSLLLPSLFARLFRLAAAYNLGPRFYIPLARITLAALSLPAVAAVYTMARRSSQTHAIIVGLVAATWFELVYFSFRPLTEAIATDFLLVSLALASVPEIEYSARRLSVIGFCLGMTLMLRIHFGVALAILAFWVCGVKSPERWVSLLIGLLLPLIAFGASDWVAWGYPFRSYVQAIRINVLQGKASTFGVEPFYWYLQQMAQIWAGALPILILLITTRLRKSGLWVAVALTIIVTHSLIPHKEYRFIFPAFACLILVAAMGSADMLQKLHPVLLPKTRLYLSAAVALIWVGTSVSLAFAPGFHDNWFKRRALIKTFFSLSVTPNLCGLLLYDHSWGATGGYAYLHRNVPMYSTFLDGPSAKHAESAFNFIIVKRSSIPDLEPDFTVQNCDESDVCLMMRPGACTGNDEVTPLINEFRLGDPTVPIQTR